MCLKCSHHLIVLVKSEMSPEVTDSLNALHCFVKQCSMTDSCAASNLETMRLTSSTVSTRQPISSRSDTGRHDEARFAEFASASQTLSKRSVVSSMNAKVGSMSVTMCSTPWMLIGCHNNSSEISPTVAADIQNCGYAFRLPERSRLSVARNLI